MKAPIGVSREERLLLVFSFSQSNQSGTKQIYKPEDWRLIEYMIALDRLRFKNLVKPASSDFTEFGWKVASTLAS